MASIVDRGDSYHVIYLGSCMLSHMSTGLGVLQKPLRELYFKYRQSGGGPAAQERHLVMSGKGMTMTYKESASAMPTQVFYAMPNILFWDGVQFCTVRGPDKKIRGAFEPIDNDHSRNKDNLFSVLEKKYHFLQQMTHPPLFTCVLRRTSGVKALDVHAFVCSSDEEALSIVKALHTLHNNYKSDETTETGVFGYRPFNGGAPGTGGVGGGAGVVGGGGGGHPDTAGHLLPGPGVTTDGHYQPQYSGPGQGQMTPSPLGSRSGSLDGAPPPRPARPVSLGRRTGGQYGQIQVLPTDPQSQARLSSYGQSGSLSSLQSVDSVRGRSKVYQLTQEDFQRTFNSRSEGTTSPNGAWREQHNTREKQGSPDRDDNNHVYQYIRHIENSPVNTLERNQKEGKISSPNSDNKRFIQDSPIHERIHNNNGSIERESMPISRSRALVEDTLANQHKQIGNLNNRIGSQSNRPVSRVSVFGGHFNKERERDINQDFSKLGQSYGLASGGSAQHLPGQGLHDLEGHSIGSGSSLSPQHHRGSRDLSLEGEPPARPPPRATERFKSSREDLRPGSSASNHSSQRGSPFVDRRPRDSPFGRNSPTKSPAKENPDPPVRPVAKVPPHISTGVRVLPPAEAMNLKSTGARTPEDRPKTFYDDNKISSGGKVGSQFGLPPRRARSQYFDDPQYMDESSSSSDNSPVKSPPGSNWAFGRSEQGDRNGTRDQTKNNENSQMNEKLLLSKKKDAEIASVLQNLRFDYESSTMSPGLPAGNNFEKSLGYFP